MATAGVGELLRERRTQRRGIRNDPLDDPELRRVHVSLQRMLDAHDPCPGVAIDRRWNVVLTHAAAGALTQGLPAALAGPPLDVYRICLHPDGLAALLDEVGAYPTSRRSTHLRPAHPEGRRC
jgi:hypothetical protein